MVVAWSEHRAYRAYMRRLTAHLFDPIWDVRSAWRTQQLLAIPMLIERKYLMGVVLLINKRSADRFTAVEEDCAREVAAALGIALYRQYQPTLRGNGMATVQTQQTQLSQEFQNGSPEASPASQERERSQARAAKRPGKFDYLLEQQVLTRHDQQRARIAEVAACAQQEGMTTLLQDGVLKVLARVTDMLQVRAVASK
jgi:hypothetical protein